MSGCLGRFEGALEEVWILETCIDDMSPELLAGCVEVLFEKGALDVFSSPVYMKKGRIGTELKIISKDDKLDTLVDILLSSTTTIGMRIKKENRIVLSREIVQVETRYGKINAKKAFLGDRIYGIYPEYESMKKMAGDNGVTVKDLLLTVKTTCP